MNVTKDNFEAVVQELGELLPTAAFVAIDEEMTGIHIPGVFVERMDDSTEERYAKMKTVAETYRIIQIGLCLFHEVPQQQGTAAAAPSATSSYVAAPPKRYVARPYNFYLFPEEGAVNMEASAIAFNKNHGMDFNKWIYEGIPYVTDEGEKKLRDKFYGGEEGWKKELARVARKNQPASSSSSDEMTDASSSSSQQPAAADGSAAATAAPSSTAAPGSEKKQRKPITLDKESDIAFLESVKQQIKTWLSTRTDEQHEFLLPEANSFLRLAVHQWLDSPEAIAELAGFNKADMFLDSRTPNPQMKYKVNFYFCYYSEADRIKLEGIALDKKRKEFQLKIGFKAIWNLLTQATRPIIVHNGFYDLLFMWTHFESALLPQTLTEWKINLFDKFPAGVFDTKFLSGSRQFANPFEFLNKINKLENKSSVSQSLSQRVEVFNRFNFGVNSSNGAAVVDPIAILQTQARFRENHLEKLYLSLMKETEARKKFEENGGIIRLPAPTPMGEHRPRNNGNGNKDAADAIALPPVPTHPISIELGAGFSKYALIGQPGGDESAAHEAGYDAYMTAVIFASFAAEAPTEEIMHLLTPANLGAQSKWLNRVPLYRHLCALDLNVDPATRVCNNDSLVDDSVVVYLLKGFPNDWKTDDILALFEGPGRFCNRKRKMDSMSSDGEAAKKSHSDASATTANGSQTAAMTDVSESASASSAAVASPSSEPLTNPPRVIWVDDATVFLTVPRDDAAKLAAFLPTLQNELNQSIEKSHMLRTESGNAVMSEAEVKTEATPVELRKFA